jgi:hypothetical protein
MQFVGLNKYLLGFGLLAALNLPLFIYSQSLLRASAFSKRSQLHKDVVVETFNERSEEPDEAPTHTQTASHDNTAAHANTQAPHANASAHSAYDPKDDVDYQRPFWVGYKPPLLQRCKRLHDKYLNESLEPKTFKAFAYSFDGANASCAAAYSPKSQRHADTSAIKECKENNSSTRKIASCRIYILNESSQP